MNETVQDMAWCFSVPEACHQVHDAVYSIEVIDPRLMGESVLDGTGFVVKIS
ncbi:MAG: hypothetical protein PHH41_04010 [Sulfurimonas sp.]|nr:hypothetical protein [Sulfurimonas sp.]MDD5202286.1 hypothetical protein [Sulfurimonas sp.]